MDYDAVHLACEGSTVDAGVVLDRIHIYKDSARYYTLALEVAIIEGDHIGKVVVTDEVYVTSPKA